MLFQHLPMRHLRAFFSSTKQDLLGLMKQHRIWSEHSLHFRMAPLYKALCLSTKTKTLPSQQLETVLPEIGRALELVIPAHRT